jgi:uncharacterized protein (TIGR04255 family)
MTTSITPSFRNPPVVEVVLNLQFDPMAGFRNAHLGAFWKSLGKGWELVDDVPYQPEERERFGDEMIWQWPGTLRLQLSPTAPGRIRVRNEVLNRVVQIQNGRLSYNWVRSPHGTESAYPRYNVIKPEFDRLCEDFTRFLANEGLGDPKANQWEITYVNEIVRGTVWNDAAEWPGLFCGGLFPPTALDGSPLESVGASWSYEIPPHRGRLHVNLQRVMPNRGADTQDSLLLQLTCRGPVLQEGSRAAQVSDGLDLGHRAIVRSFATMTSFTAQEYWGREQ